MRFFRLSSVRKLEIKQTCASLAARARKRSARVNPLAHSLRCLLVQRGRRTRDRAGNFQVSERASEQMSFRNRIFYFAPACVSKEKVCVQVWILTMPPELPRRATPVTFDVIFAKFSCLISRIQSRELISTSRSTLTEEAYYNIKVCGYL